MSIQAVPDSSKQKFSSSWLQRVASNLGFPATSGFRDTIERAINVAAVESDDVSVAQQRTMLLAVLGFGTMRVSEVIVPRADIVAVEEGESLSTLFKLFVESEHSRIPVFKESLDNVVGMIHVKDALAWATRQAASDGIAVEGGVHAQDDLNLGAVNLAASIQSSALTREMLFVPPSMRAVDLLAKMRLQRIHLAVVVDEFGGTDGLISIEDLVEAIVGDICDEHDTEERPTLGAENQGFVAPARTPIQEVERVLNMSLTSPGVTDEVDTLGGLILAMEGTVPKRGQVIEHPSGVTFEILEAGARRLHKVRITRPHTLLLEMDRAAAPLLLPAPASMPSTVDSNRKRIEGNDGSSP